MLVAVGVPDGVGVRLAVGVGLLVGVGVLLGARVAAGVAVCIASGSGVVASLTCTVLPAAGRPQPESTNKHTKAQRNQRIYLPLP